MKTGSKGIKAIMRRVTYPVRGVCGAQGGHDTAEVRGVWRTVGGRRLRGGPGKKVDGMFPGRSHSFRYLCRNQGTTAARDEGEWRKTTE